MSRMNITPDLLFLNIHNPFTNERISVYMDKHCRMSLDRKDYFLKQISHLSKGVVIVTSAICQFTIEMLDSSLPLTQVEYNVVVCYWHKKYGSR